MTVSELIIILQNLQQKYGDLPVYLTDTVSPSDGYGDTDVAINLCSEDNPKYRYVELS